jgi:hypothetical protein
MTRNEALALLAGAGAAPRSVLLDYNEAKDEGAYRRAIDAFDALGVQLRVEWDKGGYERVALWLGDTNELTLRGPQGVRTHAPIESLSQRMAPAVVPDWAA